MADNLSVCIASYESRDLAEQDFATLKDLKAGGAVELLDAAVVTRDDHGRVAVVKDLHHQVRKGALIGGVLALLGPVGLVTGVVGGSVIGKVASHFHGGLSHKDISELGALLEARSIALIALTRGAGSESFADRLPSATSVDQRVVSTDHVAFNALVEQGDREDWKNPSS